MGERGHDRNKDSRKEQAGAGEGMTRDDIRFGVSVATYGSIVFLSQGLFESIFSPPRHSLFIFYISSFVIILSSIFFILYGMIQHETDYRNESRLRAPIMSIGYNLLALGTIVYLIGIILLIFGVSPPPPT